MKLLSVAVPCYNSQAYMEKCVDSLLEGGDQVEILIVDDGSSDDTAKIADDYAARYPGIVKAIHQENGGHGEAVNTGLKNATGIFFKVVDSDDWVNKEAYEAILTKLSEIVGGHRTAQRVRSGAAETHLLRGQPVCLSAAAFGEDHVLYGREFLPIFYRQGGPVSA